MEHENKTNETAPAAMRSGYPLNLLPKTKEDKEAYSIALFKSTLEELRKIGEAENVKVSNIIRHLINNFLDDYRAWHK